VFVSSIMIPPLMRGAPAGVIAVTLLSGCGASDRQAPDPSTLELSKPEGISGDFQVEVAGRRLRDSLRVLVTRDSQPVEGVTVIWFTTEGSVSPTRARTGPDGLAATTWTTMELYAEQFATATVEGGPWIGFNAIATPDPDGPNAVLVHSEGGNRLEPAELAVPVGGTVNWVWSPWQHGPPTHARRRRIAAALGRTRGLAEVARVHVYPTRSLPLPLLGARRPGRRGHVRHHHRH
jgi:hypothetical protein